MESSLILDYAAPRGAGLSDGPPIDSRLVMERLGDGGVRITDPPAGWRGGAGPALVAVVALMLTIALAVWTIEAARMGTPDIRARAMLLMAPACLTGVLLEEARRRARQVTMIEVREGWLVIEQPSVLTPRLEWPAGRVKDVRARFALPELHRLRMSSAVQIIPTGVAFAREVLRNRPVEEVKWVVAMLKRELGLEDQAERRVGRAAMR